MKNLDATITSAQTSGVHMMLVPGTDIESSESAVEIAGRYDGIYAAVGIHPHHAFEILEKELAVDEILRSIEALLQKKHVMAVGEIGLDRHQYLQTKYDQYKISNRFMEIQKSLFRKQIQLAKKHRMSVIIHNREATTELLEILDAEWDVALAGTVVFHCCEASDELLQFAQEREIFIGVDGDVTYDHIKQDFISRVPIEMLVLETDSPFLLPEPLKSEKQYPNVPKNVRLVAQKVAQLHGMSIDEIEEITWNNGQKLLGIA